MDSKQLGRITWPLIHCYAVHLDQTHQPWPVKIAAMNRFMLAIRHTFPCGICARHMRQRWAPFVRQFETEGHSRRPRPITRLLHGFHNYVTIQKPGYDARKTPRPRFRETTARYQRLVESGGWAVYLCIYMHAVGVNCGYRVRKGGAGTLAVHWRALSRIVHALRSVLTLPTLNRGSGKSAREITSCTALRRAIYTWETSALGGNHILGTEERTCGTVRSARISSRQHKAHPRVRCGSLCHRCPGACAERCDALAARFVRNAKAGSQRRRSR